ncbi:MAG: hypothetical protein MJK12_20975 [Colwellia sp.]|nr:hypothetical protein [Colwellia sp.]
MNFPKSVLALSTLVILNGCVVIASPSYADVHLTKELTLDAKSLSELEIEAGAGSLSIKGMEGLTEIQVKAEIYTSSEDHNDYELTLSDSGSTGHLIAKRKDNSGFWSGNSHSAHIDLEVLVPQHLMLDIEDGSGDTLVKNMNSSVKIKDGSGELIIHNVTGNVTIDDGSGRIQVTEVVGNLDIEDGSGEIKVSDIKGHIEIDDGSGSITVKNVEGNTHIEDGSGDLTVSHVSGMVTVDDGSGDIDVQDAGGLKILETGSGGLRIKNVKGEFEIDS